MKFIFCSDWNMLQKSFGEQFLSLTKVYEWHKMFKEGRESVDDGAQPGRRSPSYTSTKWMIWFSKIVDWQSETILTWILEGSVKTILSDSNKISICAKNIQFQGKKRHVEMCVTMLSDYQDKMKCNIFEAKILINAYYAETADQ